jgi:hypothetical protein
MARAVGDGNPDTWKRMERALPAAFKSMSKAARVSGVLPDAIDSGRTGEDFRRGGAVIDYDPADMEHNLEQIAQFFGFSPTRVNDRYKLRATQEDHRAYYMTWRQSLLEAMNYVRMQNDPEGIKDVGDAIDRFNRSVPDAKLKISGKSKRRSRKASDQRARLRENAEAFEKGFKRDFREIKSLFPTALP